MELKIRGRIETINTTAFLILARRIKIIIIIMIIIIIIIVSSKGFCRFSGPQSENERKQKERQILGPCLRVKNTETQGWRSYQCTV